MDVIGRYQLLDKLGQGGMGVVHRGYDTLLQRPVAIKLISAPIEEHADLRERFFREARAAGQLTHKNIITIHDLGEHEGRPYLAMELLEGADLQRRLAEGEPMSLAHKLDLCIELSQGLEFAHAHGVIHRDVKPANVFITTTGSVKILDFGLARLVTSDLTNTNMMMGTLNYMAPEQVRGERADHRSDVFSVGVVMYELFSGRKAFQGDSFASTLFKILEGAPRPLIEIDATLPREVVAVVERALSKARDDRQQSMSELVRELTACRQQIELSQSPSRGYSAMTVAHRVPSDVPRLTSAPPASAGTRVQTAIDHAASEAPTGLPMPTPIGSQPPSGIGRSRSRAPRTAGRAAVIIALIGASYWIMHRTSSPTAAPTGAPPQTAAPVTASPSAQPPAPATAPAPAPPVTAAPAPELPADASRATLEAAARDARTRMEDAKAAARRTGAAKNNGPAYERAAGAEREGGRLFKSGAFAEATTKFYEAAGLYRSAETSIQHAASAPPAAAPAPVVEAPAAAPPPQPQVQTPAPPPVERQPQPAPPPVTTPASPPPATVIVMPPPSPAPTPPATPAPPAEDAIKDVLTRYQAALEARSLEALKRLWPSLAGAQQSAIQNEFQHATSIAVTLIQPRITVSGPSATVTFTRRYHLQTTDGQRLQTDTRTVMTLHLANGAWLIEQMRFER